VVLAKKLVAFITEYEDGMLTTKGPSFSFKAIVFDDNYNLI